MKFTIKKRGSGWVVVDEKGGIHSARIQDKVRAQSQADTMSKKLSEIKENFKRERG